MPETNALTGLDRFAADTHQFLTFALGDEEYGLAILKVQEIKGFSAITPMPNTPNYVKGVMNLRGIIIPVIDLRLKFALPAIEYSRFHVIIVVTVGTKVMGLLVDAVKDVLNVPAAEVQPAPDFGAAGTGCAVNGLVRSEDKVVLLLNIDRLLEDALPPSP